MKEVWKSVPIEPFDGCYEVSNLGRVCRLINNKRRLLKPHFNKQRQYYYVSLQVNNKIRRNFILHRLVAMAFVPGKSFIFNVVDHVDFNRHNNSASNLEWVTNAENSRRARAAGRVPINHGENCGMSRLTKKLVWKILEKSKYLSQKQLAVFAGVRPCTISLILSGKRWAREVKEFDAMEASI